MNAPEFRAVLLALPCSHCEKIDALDMPDASVAQELREFRELAGHWGSCSFRLEREREAAAVEAMLAEVAYRVPDEDYPVIELEEFRAAYLAARRGT